MPRQYTKRPAHALIIAMFQAARLSKRPVLLDLFCGGGGAAAGYYRAGFAVIGVDLKQCRSYPFPIIHWDALEIAQAYGHLADAIHASPPCQLWCQGAGGRRRPDHADLITPLRPILNRLELPYIIESVPQAAHLLVNPIFLDGSMFPDLPIKRRRAFECSDPPALLPERNPNRPALVLLTGQVNRSGHPHRENTVAERVQAIGLKMSDRELTEAIPWQYTHWLALHCFPFQDRSTRTPCRETQPHTFVSSDQRSPENS